MGLLLTAAGCQSPALRPLTDFGQRVGDIIAGRTAEQDARRMFDPDFPDERRYGVNRLVARDYGTHPPYTEQYKHLVRLDRSPLVRATALRALNRSRDASASDVFVAALSDADPLVRLEAAKALVHIPTPAASAKLLELARNPREDLDVRIAATDALRHYKTVEVGRTLAGMLLERHFALAWQARRSLVDLTGTDLRYDEGAWLQYITSDAFRQA